MLLENGSIMQSSDVSFTTATSQPGTNDRAGGGDDDTSAIVDATVGMDNDHINDNNPNVEDDTSAPNLNETVTPQGVLDNVLSPGV